MRRLDRAGTGMAVALHLLPAAGGAGYQTPEQLASGLAVVFRARLEPVERLCVAAAAVMSLDAETAEELAEAALHDLRAGSPLAPFQSLRDEARYWAVLASPAERQAYLSAIWNHTPERERAGFLRAVRPAKQRTAT